MAKVKVRWTVTVDEEYEAEFEVPDFFDPEDLQADIEDDPEDFLPGVEEESNRISADVPSSREITDIQIID